MKIIPTDQQPNSRGATIVPVRCDNIAIERTETPGSIEETPAESALARRIFEEGNGRTLIKFCRELSGVLIRRYIVEADVEVLRTKVCASLVKTLGCTETQAQCLVDLSMELIHAKLYGRYRRTNVELSYLIATATGAVKDVTAN